MKVVELKTVEGKVRYYLADDTGATVDFRASWSDDGDRTDCWLVD